MEHIQNDRETPAEMSLKDSIAKYSTRSRLLNQFLPTAITTTTTTTTAVILPIQQNDGKPLTRVMSLKESIKLTSAVRHNSQKIIQDIDISPSEQKINMPPGNWIFNEKGIGEIRITSYAHYISILTDHKALFHEITGRYNRRIMLNSSPYRRNSLQSTISHMNQMHKSGQIAQLFEADLIRHFIETYNISNSSEMPTICKSNIWALLAFMHRHDCATRLMEWTFNPNVALFMAVNDTEYMNQDGEIWIVRPNELHRCQSQILASKLEKMHVTCPTVIQFQEALSTALSLDVHIDPLEVLHAFDAMSSSIPTVAFFEPPHFDTQMMNQSIAFSLTSNPLLSIDEVLVKYPQCVQRVIIPNFLKGVLRDTLDFMGVHERMLFPGLNGLSASLKRFFTRDYRPTPNELQTLFLKRIKDEQNENNSTNNNNNNMYTTPKIGDKGWPISEQSHLNIMKQISFLNNQNEQMNNNSQGFEGDKENESIMISISQTLQSEIKPPPPLVHNADDISDVS